MTHAELDLVVYAVSLVLGAVTLYAWLRAIGAALSLETDR